MTRIDDAVDKILKDEPHLTRLEAIKLLSNKNDKKRYQAKKIKSKGKPAKGRIRVVSGGAVSPR